MNTQQKPLPIAKADSRPAASKLDGLVLDDLNHLNADQLEALVKSVRGNIDWTRPQNFMGSGGGTVYNPAED